MENNKVIPQLRFPGFEGDWEKKKFKDITFPAGKKNSQNLPYERYSISNEVGFYPQSDQFEDGGGYLKDIDCRQYIVVPPKSFAYNPARINIGSIGYQDLGKEVIVSSLYEVFRTSDACYDPFLWQWFHSDVFHRMVVNVQEGGVRQYFFYEKLKECSIRLPSFSEQKKIADLLTTVDEMISIQEQKVETLKAHKKGLMQQLFPQPGETTPPLRFPGFSSEWVEVTIGDVFNLRNGYTPSKSEESFWSDGKLAWFRMDDIREKGHILYDSAQHITESAVKGNKLFEANTIIVATSATIGEHALIRVKHLANQRFVNLSIKDSYLSKTNIEYAYQFMFIVDEICKSKVNVGAFASISTEVFSGLPYLMPSLEEQRVITGCLSAIDDVIDLEEKKAKSLKQLKKGLVQNLFPL